MRQNIFAYTAPTPNYPEYVSINLEEDGQMTVIVRSPMKKDGTCGETASATLSPEEVRKLKAQIAEAR